jgi:hypothetical protein
VFSPVATPPREALCRARRFPSVAPETGYGSPLLHVDCTALGYTVRERASIPTTSSPDAVSQMT